VGQTLVLEKRPMLAVSTRQLRHEAGVFDEVGLHDRPTSHETVEQATEAPEGVSTLGVHSAEHPAFVKKHVTRRVAERTRDSTADLAFLYGRHYCPG
jgi:hypothetical protein